MSRTEIVEDFPELTDDDITACLQFAADRERQSVTIKVLWTMKLAETIYQKSLD